MSTVCCSIVLIPGLTGNGTSAPVEAVGTVGASESLTSASGSTATSTLVTASRYTGDDPRQHIWRVCNMGSDHIYVAFGTTPDPTATTATSATTARKGIPAGGVCYFSSAAFGEKVAVRNSA